jgi:hypothetical protein
VTNRRSGRRDRQKETKLPRGAHVRSAASKVDEQRERERERERERKRAVRRDERKRSVDYVAALRLSGESISLN